MDKAPKKAGWDQRLVEHLARESWEAANEPATRRLLFGIELILLGLLVATILSELVCIGIGLIPHKPPATRVGVESQLP